MQEIIHSVKGYFARDRVHDVVKSPPKVIPKPVKHSHGTEYLGGTELLLHNEGLYNEIKR